MRWRTMRPLKTIPLAITMLAACSGHDEPPTPPAPELQLVRAPSESRAMQPRSDSPAQAARERLNQIAVHVSAWRDAPNLAEAKRHAEAARNLVVGPAGPHYGDADRDGKVSGANAVGLLPGMRDSAALAIPSANVCIARDLLGGNWGNPARRWAILEAKIAAWRPDNNTFPTLPSHAQRIVGWATLTLRSFDVATARGYAAHAKLHVDVSRTAVNRC